MKKKPDLTRRFARAANLKIILLLGFTMLFAGARAQCLQPHPQNYYSRVISSSNLSSGSFIQSDYDAVNDHLYVPSTYGSSSTEAYLTSINGQGYMDNGWGNRYAFTGNEHCLATKCTVNNGTGDIVMAGTTLGTSGNTVIFVMMIQSNGTLLWAKYYEQSAMNADYRILITETKVKGHIVVAASSVSSNDHILIRLDHNGTLLYYSDFSVLAGSNTSESFAVINGIAATSDDGYVIVGTTGQNNNDYYAAVALKYDANYFGLTAPTLNWATTYRHYLPSYNLASSSLYRSSTIAKGVMQDPSSDIIVVGYQSDHDTYFNQTNYQNGFIWTLDNFTGTQKALFNYGLSNGFVSFNGIALDYNNTSNNYIVTGSVADMQGNSQTLLANIVVSIPYSTVSWANSYGGTHKNVGLNVFYRNTAQDYLSVGVSDEYLPGTFQANVIGIDRYGNMPGSSCSEPLSLNVSTDTNDSVAVISDTTNVLFRAPNLPGTAPVYYCEAIAQLCGPCVQTPTTQYYSRVLTAHINQDFLRADYDKLNKKVYVPANYDGGTGTLSDVFWSKVDALSPIDFSNRYSITGNEKTRAVKLASDGAIIIAGTTKGFNGNNVLYIMRTDASGVPLWYHYYDQGQTDVTYYPVVTETSTSKDIVVAASGRNISATDTSGRNILLRVDSNGTMRYYDSHPVTVAANTVEYNPFINDITSTQDDGYVVVGTSGHNSDFRAATAVKYDMNYNITLVHLRNWKYCFRRPSAAGGYDFSVPSKRSSSEAQGVTEDSNTGDIIIVGNTSDAGTTAYSATYQLGLIIRLSAGGLPLNQNIYYNGYGFLLDFNDVIVDTAGNYMVTGDAYDINNFVYHSQVTKLQLYSGNFFPAWSYMYGSYGTSKGYSIFQNGSKGYISIGVTNYENPDFYTYPTSTATLVFSTIGGPTAPYVLSVDNNGLAGNCYGYLSLYSPEVVTNDQPKFQMGSSTSATSRSGYPLQESSCVFMTERCVSPFVYPQNYRLAQNITGFAQTGEANLSGNDNSVKLYPNPASDLMNIEVTTVASGGGQIIVQDIQGRTILTSNINFTEGLNRFDISLLSLEKGIYFLQLAKNDAGAKFPVTKLQKN